MAPALECMCKQHADLTAVQATARVVVQQVDVDTEAQQQEDAAAAERSDHEQRMQEHQQVGP